MNEQRRASGPHPDPDGKLGISEESNFNEGRQGLSEQEEFNKEEKRVLDLLTQGLSREFPNPHRVGCPDSAVLRGIAFRKLRLAEVEPWLEHLSSCSPCFHDFTELRKQAASQRRRTQVWLAAAAVLIFAVAGWLWMRTQHSVQPTETAVLDLRELSVSRGQDSPQTDQRTLEIHRSAKHLILDLPVGSKEGAYDIGILSESGAQIMGATGTAQLQDHVVGLRADLDVSGIRPGLYFLALRQPGTEWTRYPLRVF
ncbi:MAG TPA: hypothetical protein VKG65_02360 [Terriglobales bacterium]|nr:hypothetical protein [Terriglobales bacterium]